MSMSINGNITGPYVSVVEGDALSNAYEEKGSVAKLEKYS